MRRLYTVVAALLAACAAPLTPVAAQTAQDSAHVSAAKPKLDTLRVGSDALVSFCQTKTARSYPTMCKASANAARQFSSLFAGEQITNFVFVQRVDTVRTIIHDTVKVIAQIPVDTAKTPVDTAKSPADTLVPVASPGHPHEPAGFTKLVQTLSCDTLPLSTYNQNVPTPGELGWVNNYGWSLTTDVNVPFASKSVCQNTFPAGFPGGSGSAQFYVAGYHNPESWPNATPPRSPKSLYMSFWYEYSPNYPANLVANKVVYPHVNYSQVPVATMLWANADFPLDANGIMHKVPNGATPYTAGMLPAVCFQGDVEIDGSPFNHCLTEEWLGTPWEQMTQVKRGRWHHWETLYTLEDDGGAHNGSVTLWLDGKKIVDVQKRIRFRPTETFARFDNVTFTNVYGGGGMVPNDATNVFQRLKDAYVSGNP